MTETLQVESRLEVGRGKAGSAAPSFSYIKQRFKFYGYVAYQTGIFRQLRGNSDNTERHQITHLGIGRGIGHGAAPHLECALGSGKARTETVFTLTAASHPSHQTRNNRPSARINTHFQAAKLTMAAKESALRLAPPTRAPSISAWAIKPLTLSGLTLPP